MDRIKQNILAHGMLRAVGALHTTARPTIWVTHTDGHRYTVEVLAPECQGPLLFAGLHEAGGKQAIELMFDGLARRQTFHGPEGWRDKTAKHRSERPVLEPA